jgi:hypothetical protein
MTPSLSNFITSLFAGLFLVIVPIGAAVVTVSRIDPLAREEA